jgi:hypothetical protein
VAEDDTSAWRAGPLAAARRWLWATFALSVGAVGAAVVWSPPLGASPVIPLALLIFVGSSVHVASTAWIYTQPEVRAMARRHSLRYVWGPVGLVVGSATLATFLTPPAFVWLLLPYFSWQFFHFTKQNLGLAALSATSHQVAPLGQAERRALIGSGLAGILGLLAHPALLQLALPVRAGRLFVPAGVLFALCGLVGLVALLRRPARDRPAGFCAMYGSALVFSLPIFLFARPYAAVGGMTMAHGLQYLLLIGVVASGVRTAPRRTFTLTVLINLALIGGVLLSAASHLHGAPPAGRCLFGAYLGLVMAHFVIDAGFWRLRDPFPRSFLARHIPFLFPLAGSLADTSWADIGSR